MKKTEKIEIRLSHADKTSLTELAQRENRTISQLVRHLIQNYVGLNTSTRPIKMPLTKIGMFITSGFIAGCVLVYGLLNMGRPTVYDLYISLGFDSNLSTTIPIQNGFETKLTMPDKTGDVDVLIKLESSQTGLNFLKLELCKTTKNKCEIFATPSLLINKRKASSLEFQGIDDKRKYIEIKPARQSAK